MSNKTKVQLYDESNENPITPMVDIDDINITNDNIKNTGVLYDNYLPFYREDSSGVYLNMDNNLSGGNKNDFVIGKNNVPDSSSLFTVGCGYSNDNKCNALLITDDGSVYIGDKEDKNKVAIQDDISILRNDISTDISVMATKTDINELNDSVKTINDNLKNLKDGFNYFYTNKSIELNNLDNDARGFGSLAGGNNSTAYGDYSFVYGNNINTDFFGNTLFACGKYNDVSSDSLFVVGNGTDDDNRSTTFEIKTNDSAYFAGDIYEKNKKLSEKYAALKHYHDEYSTIPEVRVTGGVNLYLTSVKNNSIYRVKNSTITITPDLFKNSPYYNFMIITDDSSVYITANSSKITLHAINGFTHTYNSNAITPFGFADVSLNGIQKYLYKSTIYNIKIIPFTDNDFRLYIS